MYKVVYFFISFIYPGKYTCISNKDASFHHGSSLGFCTSRWFKYIYIIGNHLSIYIKRNHLYKMEKEERNSEFIQSFFLLFVHVHRGQVIFSV